MTSNEPSPAMSPSISGNMYRTEVALQISGTGLTATPHGKKKTRSS